MHANPDGARYLKGGFEAEDPGIAGPVARQAADRVPVTYVPAAKDDSENVAPLPVVKKRLAQAAKAASRRALAVPAELDPLRPRQPARF